MLNIQGKSIFKENWEEFHPIFQYPFLRGSVAQDKDFARTYIIGMQYLKEKIEKIKIVNAISKALTTFFPRCDVLFYSSKFEELALSLKEKREFSVGFMGGFKTSKTALKSRAVYYPVLYWFYNLIRIFEMDPQFSSLQAKSLVNEFISFLKDKKVRYIVLPNDSLFLERFIIFCAKQLGVPTICIQDGLFHSKTNSEILYGQFADYMFLWGESQKKLYNELKSKSRIADLKILGYPFYIESNAYKLYKNKICILGQPYENYNLNLGIRKKKIFENIINLLRKTGYFVVYKPHPAESNKNFIPNNARLYVKNLKKAFREFGIFISLTSTALLEASLNRRIAVQIYDPDFRGDNFEEKRYSYAINVENLNNLPSIIRKLSSPYEVPQHVIYIPKNIGERFLELLQGI